MSVQLRVELADYSLSISMSQDDSVAELKKEIFQTCPGRPHVAGQRLFCKGRLLVDSERLADVWKSPEEAKVVHLAVNPSAWTAERHQAMPSHTDQPTPRASVPPNISSSTVTHPLTFVLFKHEQALAILTHGKTPVIQVGNLDAARSASLVFVRNLGWSWPSSLDAPIPPAEEGGVEYDAATLNGHSYLALKNPGVEPTRAQLLAIQVLSLTFPILFSPAQHHTPTPTTSTPHFTLPPNLFPNANVQPMDHHLNQIGLHPPPPNPPANANPNMNIDFLRRELRGFLWRQTIYSYLYLALRTVLLLYFVSPARKPMIAILIFLWVLYEMWRPFRAALLAAAAARDREGNAPEQANPLPQPGDPGRPAGEAADIPPPRAQTAHRPVEHQVLQHLASVNIEDENRMLDDTPAAPVPAPTLYHKTITFLQLFFVTIHPEIWNMRRTSLRRREGRIKAEWNGRRQDEEGSQPTAEQSTEAQNRVRARADLIARHLSRPAWVREYTERVVSGDWVDDAD